MRLQCWQRLITSKKLLSLLAMNKQMREVRERNAAKMIQQVNMQNICLCSITIAGERLRTPPPLFFSLYIFGT